MPFCFETDLIMNRLEQLIHVAEFMVDNQREKSCHFSYESRILN
jgi:hypothetical protein